MVKLIKHSSKDGIPKGDYVFEKMEKVYDVLSILTPKFDGHWVFILIDPKLTFVKTLIEDTNLPEWVEFQLLLSTKKLEKIVLDYPQLQPKEKTRKEEIDEVIANLKHLIDEKAKKYLIGGLGGNLKEFKEVIQKLDSECKTSTITLKDVKSAVQYNKRVYASSVVNAFLLKESNRWNLLETLVHDLGSDYAYNACYKYVKGLLKDKQAYLLNQDVTNYIVKRIDAPLICYIYILFSNSNSSKELASIFYCVENRSEDSLNLLLN